MRPVGPDVAAARRLTQAFLDGLGVPATIRLWDGSTVASRIDPPARFAVVVRSRRVLLRLLWQPTPLRFGEAFIDGRIDIEGDLFEAMRTAHRLRHRVTLRTLLRRLMHP